MLEEIAKPTTVLQCHPKWFHREVVEKRRAFQAVVGEAGDPEVYRVKDWPQSHITLNSALPPEGFYAT